MHHQNPIINDIVLTIINDGNGSQCGMDYAARCAAAENGIASYRAACRYYNLQRSYAGAKSATRAEMLEAESVLQGYYRQHMQEATS